MLRSQDADLALVTVYQQLSQMPIKNWKLLGLSFLVYMTNPKYRLDIETGRGLLVISPRDTAALSSALSASMA